MLQLSHGVLQSLNGQWPRTVFPSLFDSLSVIVSFHVHIPILLVMVLIVHVLSVFNLPQWRITFHRFFTFLLNIPILPTHVLILIFVSITELQAWPTLQMLHQIPSQTLLPTPMPSIQTQDLVLHLSDQMYVVRPSVDVNLTFKFKQWRVTHSTDGLNNLLSMLHTSLSANPMNRISTHNEVKLPDADFVTETQRCIVIISWLHMGHFKISSSI